MPDEKRNGHNMAHHPWGSSQCTLINPLISVLFLAAMACSEGGADSDCHVCNASCKNGVATSCNVLTPPGCGADYYRQFCPYGCRSDITGACNAPVDGAVSVGCVASSVTKLEGALSATASGSPAAVTQFLATETHVVVATSMNAACFSTSDAAVAPTGSGAALTLSLPTNLAGNIAIGSGARAQLTTWENAVLLIDHQSATAGTVELNLTQPGGGTMGSYDLMFPAGEERGTFVAPACDVCAAAQ